jgi:hypothetical protein
MSLLSGIMASTLPPVTSLTNGLPYGNGSWINGAPSVTTSGSSGDLLVSIQLKRNGAVSVSTPSGFTNFLETNTTNFAINASYKIATTGSETVSFANLTDTSAIVLRAVPNGRINTVTANFGTTLTETNNQNITRTLPLSTATYPVLAVALGFGSNNTKNVVTSPNLTTGIYFDADNFQNLVYYNVYNTSPGDVTVSVLADGDTVLSTFYLTVA